MKPGVIKESLNLLKSEPQMRNLNLGIDEKHLSSGVELTVKDETVSIDGDQEYFGAASTNKEKDVENLKHGLKMLEILENDPSVQFETSSDLEFPSPSTESTASALLEINTLLVNFENSLKSKNEKSSTLLTKLRSKVRKNTVNIAKEISIM